MRILVNPLTRSLYLCLMLVFLAAGAQAQQPAAARERDTQQALELYRRGDSAQAISKLSEIVKKRPDDADAWSLLATALYEKGLIVRAGLAFERLISLRPEAANAHAKLAYALILADKSVPAVSKAERALELGDQSPEAHYALAEAHFRAGALAKSLQEADAALIIKPDFLPALITKSLVHAALQQYSEAIAILENVLTISPEEIDAEAWRGQLEELRARETETRSPKPISERSIFSGKEVTERAQVLAKPEPQYTEAARKAGVTGTVVLRAVFSAEGEVGRIYVVRALGFGLTTQAVKAAHLIKFTPSKRDTRPVSMAIQLEYNFNLF
jgi:TonB family protein